MRRNGTIAKLTLLGPFRLESGSNARIEIRSKRGQALIAMLATSGSGERTRGWLQEKLWCSRSASQASASLRRELSNLRKTINISRRPLLESDNGRVWLNLDQIEIDVRQSDMASQDQFLEGIDIAGEEEFEDWLRGERSAIEQRQKRPSTPPGEASVEDRAQKASFDEFSSKPAIAVLPFADSNAAQDLQQIAQGLSEDLIDRLSRLRWLPVIARSSSFALDAGSLNPKIAGEKLGAQYIVDGSIRDHGGGNELLATLSDAASGQTVWSNRFGIPQYDDAETLEQLLIQITSALGAQVDMSEQVKAQRKPQSDLNVSELIWRGRWYLNQLTTEGFKRAEQCFDEALEREPNSPEALIQNAWVKLWQLWFNRGSKEDIQAVRKLAQRAIVADHEDARGHMLAGIAESWLYQPLRSQALLKRALELNPSMAFAYAQLGSTLYLSSKPKEAIEQLDMSVRLSPNDQHLFFIMGERAMSHLMLGQHEQAVQDADISIIRRPAYWYAHVIKINAMVAQNQMAEAMQALDELHIAFPSFRASFIDWLPFVDKSWIDFLKDGLNLLEG